MLAAGSFAGSQTLKPSSSRRLPLMVQTFFGPRPRRNSDEILEVVFRIPPSRSSERVFFFFFLRMSLINGMEEQLDEVLLSSVAELV